MEQLLMDARDPPSLTDGPERLPNGQNRQARRLRERGIEIDIEIN